MTRYARSLHELLRSYEEMTCVTVSELAGRSRTARISAARQELMAGILISGRATQSDIARFFDRDHSSVHRSIRVAQERASTQPEVAARVTAIAELAGERVEVFRRCPPTFRTRRAGN